MDAQGKLQFLGTPGNHLQFDWPWFTEHIIDKYLAPKTIEKRNFDYNWWFLKK